MTEDKTLELRRKLAASFTGSLPFCEALDMAIENTDKGAADMSMPYTKEIVGDPDTGVVHGGAVSALMDTCSGLAVFMHPNGDLPTATIDLRIDYMRAATPTQRIYCESRVFHVTRTVAFVRTTAFDDDRENPVATAMGAFTFNHKGRAA